jgi:penicillin amidase
MRWYAVIPLSLLILVVAFAQSYLNLLSPFSGSLWEMDTSSQLPNPYGWAEVYYDEYGVPHVIAENEKALAYAVGYIHAKDRLFQMDLHRRLMRGDLSEVFGEEFFDSDEFYVKMDFVGAAEASWSVIKDSEIADYLVAYSEGVNYYINNKPLPMEFKLAGYRPKEWTPIDSLLLGKDLLESYWQFLGP